MFFTVACSRTISFSVFFETYQILHTYKRAGTIVVMNILIFTTRQQVFSEMKKKKEDTIIILSCQKTRLEATVLGPSSLCTSHNCLIWRETYLSLRDSVHVFSKLGSLTRMLNSVNNFHVSTYTNPLLFHCKPIY